MSKFKVGDKVFVNSYKGCKAIYYSFEEYPITKIGMTGIFKEYKKAHNGCVVDFGKEAGQLLLNVDDLEFEEVLNSPLYQALL